MSDADADAEVFLLTVTAAFYHPSHGVRVTLRDVLDAWLEKLEGVPAESDVRKAISSEKGTPVEPFLLSDQDLDCAVFLTRAAFSTNGKQTRVRIVSRETMGTQGGLVLTQNLKSFYVERYIHGKRRGQPKQGWTFIPALVPSSVKVRSRKTKARLFSEAEGFRIVVALPELQQDGAVIARRLQQHSRINGVSEPFNKLGLRIECRKREVHILSGSPESMIRIMAHMVAQSSLILRGEEWDSRTPTILVGLALPEDQPVKLPAVASATAGYLPCISATAPAPLVLQDEHILAISSWLPPHSAWVNLVFNNLQ